jgi:pimeloyl-ACP methyl ester carboxylesterase
LISPRRELQLSTLKCTASAQPVTLLQGAYSIDGFRSNYVVAKPEQSSSSDGAAKTSLPPIVLVHGLGSNKAHFNRNIQALAALTGTAVYALDLLGHGQSAKPQSVSYDCSLWDWQVEALVKDVIKEKVFVVGHSLGGYIAMRLAARSPRDVAGLCMLAPAGRYGVLHPMSFNVPFVGLDPVASLLGSATFEKIGSPKAMRSTLEYLYEDPSKVSQELVDALVAPWQDAKSREAGQAICKALYQSRLEQPWDKLVSSDEVFSVVKKYGRTGTSEETYVTSTYCGPVLTIWGKGDAYLPPETNVEAIRELRADDLCEIRMVDAGHCPHDERPDEINAIISEWAARVHEEDVEFPIARKARYRNSPIADESILKI